jgi:hypothetical protein
MTKWTYYVQQYTLTELLNVNLLEGLGDEGWELACLLRLMMPVEKKGSKEILAVFKQPVLDT